MKHKFFAQLLLLVCLVVSCSEVPVKVSHTGQAANNALMSKKQSEMPSIKPMPDSFQLERPIEVSSEQRAAFLQAEQLLLEHNDAAFLAQMQSLKDHPLYPYLQSQWLKKNLTLSAEIEAFLTSYKDNRYADLLRQDWLVWLAKNQQWQAFIDHYQAETDAKKTALQCHFSWAQYNTGNQERALATAKELWLKTTTQSACDELFSALQQSPFFTEELLWQRFSASLRGKKANTKLAAQLKQQMPADLQKNADLWLKIANSNLSSSLRIWDEQQASADINLETIDYIQQKLGLGFAAAGDSANAYAYLNQVANLDENTRHALIRAALREQNWSHIDQALAKLTADEKNEDKWRYWQARAWAETGKTEQARQLFAALTKKSDFYAFLAADKLKVPYQVVHIPVPVTAQELNSLQQQSDVRAVAEWLALGRKDEAMQQWWYTIKKSSPKQIMAAAKLAQYWQQPKLAAFTIAKAEYWQDLELRFPMLYSQEINTHALQFNLDPAIVFGLIRQESVFDPLAGSNVGARGLMQIMPATGRQIARQLQEPWQSDSVLYEPETNIRYGSFYYKQLLDKFNGQVALAAAGYNAGPGRVKNWLPDRPMAMDIWIETIPFNETRHYVSMVLSNTLFYQQRMNRDVLKISDFMTDVQPLSVVNQELSLNNRAKHQPFLSLTDKI